MATPGSVLDRLPEVVFETDAFGNWTYLSPGWTRLTGFSVAESLGTNFLDYVHPDERDRTLALFAAVVEGGADYCHHEGRYLTAEGTYRWVELRATLLRGDDGVPTGNVGTLLDITPRRQAQQAVAEDARIVELLASGAPSAELPLAVLVCGPDLTVRRTSPVLSRLGASVPVGAHLPSRFDGQEGADLLEWAVRARSPRYGDADLRTDTGRLLHLQVAVLPLLGPDGAPESVAVVCHDVTELRRRQRQQEQLARLGHLALAAPDVGEVLHAAVESLVADGTEAYAEVSELLGTGPALLVRASAARGTPGISVRGLSAGGPGSPAARALAAHAPCVELIPDGGRPASALLVAVRDPEQERGVLALARSGEADFDDMDTAYVDAVARILATAISRGRAADAVRHQALHDPLTGLANRTLFMDRLEQALHSQERSSRGLALLLLDLDRFKEVNDSLGHAVGDEVLRAAAERLRGCVRASDTVSRLGGDEFAILLTDVSEPRDAVYVSQKLQRCMSEGITAGGTSLHVGGSIGIALSPTHGSDPHLLLERADIAMYEAKARASGWAVYRHGDVTPRRELSELPGLRRAVEGDQLTAYFQPAVALATGDVTAVEALARWNHPTRGLLPAAAFVPLAERAGLVRPLTSRVLGLALAQAAEWRGNGWPVPVSVNLSGRLLRDPDLVRAVEGALVGAGLPPESLTLELPGSLVLADSESALAPLSALSRLGVQLAIDDFGTGSTSLVALRDLPLQTLKIDAALVARCSHSERDAALLRSLVDVGHSLGLDVVAEGIETAAAYDLLTALGCDAGQGFVICPPVPSDQLAGLRSVDARRALVRRSGQAAAGLAPA